jgi:ArsR family transcriptional regulator, arsenate/arsenite/antimonite-responsive transcriptional repressor
MQKRNKKVKLLAPENKSRPSQETYEQEAVEQLHAPEKLVHDLGQMAKLLSDETRLRILYYLTQRDELHVRALCELLSESQPAVSHHLALLRTAGMIDRRRQGKHNFYYLQLHRFSGMLDMLFAIMPEGNRRLRFEDYMLCHSPVKAE